VETGGKLSDRSAQKPLNGVHLTAYRFFALGGLIETVPNSPLPFTFS
jgi:hypothetical protein